ncbi:hypothetical protein FB451DRAFT_1391455 [Mycena latifolia]|nr:hypothetical protein FB451DRAFT_1391455 [Mycena latifolia]
MYTATLLTLLTLAAAPTVLGEVGVHCGTTADDTSSASFNHPTTFSDCQALTDPATWDSVWAGTANTCHYGNPDTGFHFPALAYNTACHNNCCVYFASKTQTDNKPDLTPDKEQTRQDAMSLFGCADKSKNKINAMVFKSQGYGVCLSNGNGCGDCFDDDDFKGNQGCPTCV